MTEKKQSIIDKTDVIKILTIIIRNWYLVLFFPLLSFVAAYFYAHRLQDVYAAKTQILLKAQETYDYQQQISRGLGVNSLYGSYEYTAGQMRVIKSSNLIESVLDDISLNVSYYIVGRIKVTEVYENVPFNVIYDERGGNVVGTLFTLNILDDTHYGLQYEVDGVNKDKEFAFGELVLDDGLYIKIEKIKDYSPSYLEVVSNIKYQFKINSKNALFNKYKSNIDVKNIDFTSIIEVTLKDEIPERAEAFLEILAKKYLETTVASAIEVNENTQKYIDRQLDQVTEIINDIEFELESYKQNRDILNIEKQEDNYFNRLSKFDEDKLMLEQSKKALDDLTTFLLKSEDIETLLPPSLFVANSDEEISKRVTNLFKLRSEYAELMNEGTSSNPKIIAVRTSIESLKKDLLKYIDAQRTAVALQINVLNRQIADIERKIRVIPTTQRELLNIERKLQVNEKLYDFLLSKRAETIIAKAGLLPESKVIEQPRSVGIVFPDKVQIHRMGLLIGFVIAIVVIAIREFFFVKISNADQLSNATRLPILGSIPKVKNLDTDFYFTDPSERSALIQAFRSLRANLQFYTSTNQCVKILVTSLLPAEGKTFTSVNLAAIMALADYKVLVIEFDLHKPRLHKALRLNNEIGVSNYLIGQNKLDEIIKPTQNANLFAITSGPIPPNASELILKKETEELVNEAAKRFDFIFYDTPPVMLITDAKVLMQHADTKLFVLNSKNANASGLSFIEKFVEENSLGGASLILNEEVTSKFNYYYSRYTYGGYHYNDSAEYGK